VRTVSGRSPEVLILGGGPAGCAAARVLSACGHDVLLITRPSTDLRPLPESIPPSAGKLFDVLGIRAIIDAAGFVRSGGNSVWWGRGERRIEAFEHEACGWQVTTDRLERLLLDAAIDAGARVEFKRMAADEADAVGAAFTLDCTGRAGVMARARSVRKASHVPPTVALVGVWQMGGASIADPTHTWIESYGSGWAWSVPVAADRRCFSVMVDPRTSDLVQEQGARAAYLGELAKTRVFADITSEATLLDRPSGWDASMYYASEYCIDNLLLVGDAGSFIDPLSSIGVKKALASGWLAGIATHTALVRPWIRGVAFDFFAAREREIFASFERLTVKHLAGAATSHAHPFWADRAEGVPVSPRVDERLVQGAFERIKTARSVRLRPSPELRIEERPAVSSAEIVLERRVVTDEDPAGVRFLNDVDVLALIDLAPTCHEVPQLFEAYNRAHAPVSLPGFLTALASIVARKWLVMSQD